jgi:ribonuclease HI
LVRTTPGRFTAEFYATIPVFIETDGACAGNPGPGGWGHILAENGKKCEAYAAWADTNNEMELTAIKEALGFLPNVRAYVVIESDSDTSSEIRRAGHRSIPGQTLRIAAPGNEVAKSYQQRLRV